MKARKGCGPYNLGAPKPVGKKYGSPNKQIKKGVDPNLTPEESELLDTDIISDDKAQKLTGLKGVDFSNMRARLQQQQRKQDSTYMVNNRTINTAQNVGRGMSGTVTLDKGKSRPSKFKRDERGNIVAY